MKKVAIVVQRCHESIVGGSESLAWQYAGLLKDSYDVEVLTTTAMDTEYWTNVLPPGIELRENIPLHRFPVTLGRTPYWGKLHERLLQDFIRDNAGRRRDAGKVRHLPWAMSLQEEFIRTQGPYSQPLMDHLRLFWPEYYSIIFVTYLYPTTYFGLLRIPPAKALFAPTLHDEQPAYLSAYREAAHRARGLLWLTDAERRLGHDIWGDLPGRVVSMSIDTKPRPPAKLKDPYLLYCGRIDPNKGCVELFDYFIEFKRNDTSQLSLVLIGKDDIPVPRHPYIDFRGFVSDEEKFSLMAGATALAMPSGNESFSIVTLEAMAQGVPILASGTCDVIVDHINLSGGGKIYRDGATFAQSLAEMLSDDAKRSEMGASGREYVVSRFQRDDVRKTLIDTIETYALNAASGDTSSLTLSPDQQVVEDLDTPEEISPATTDAQANGAEDIQGAALQSLRQPQPLPLPEGWSEERLRELLTSVQVEDGPILELHNYAKTDFKRFVYTLSLVPEKPNLEVLELGANPYFITTLIHKCRDARLHLSNFFGRPGSSATQDVIVQQTGELIPCTYKQFNIEKDVFPYEDETFDVVLFCEIIEHLLSDPVHTLTEIRRVLKSSGVMVLTTPNAARLENVCKMVAGVNIYDAYSGYGPYGRHNREYTKHDLFLLLSANGFQIETLFTADVHDDFANSSSVLPDLESLVASRQPDLGQYIFCRSNLEANAKSLAAVRPEWLFRSG
ncbi:MAG TPA: glycosyltransferase [Pyrinomonadaceae bacterium]|nr:glycosyltransferase [Pyrinomonadaceae bacterium]